MTGIGRLGSANAHGTQAIPETLPDRLLRLAQDCLDEAELHAQLVACSRHDHARQAHHASLAGRCVRTAEALKALAQDPQMGTASC